MVEPDGTGNTRDDAIKRIKRKRMFQQQLAVYVLINILLWVIWAFGGGFPWPIFVTVFWGIGLVAQGWTVYKGAAPITEAEIQREMGKDPGTA